MVRFAVFSMVALVVVGVVTVAIAHAIARETALREARLRTASYAQNVVGPLVDRAVRQEAGGSGGLDTTMGARLRDGTLTHVLVWAEDGRIIWSDDATVTGDVLEVEDDWAGLFGTEDVVAEYSSGPEHGAFVDSSGGQVVEVYAGAFDADGEPLVLEWYWSTADLAASESAVLSRLLPLTLGSLVLLQLAVLPLALSLARRVESERSRLLGHAMAAQDLERRRLTQDLHDGVVQDLTGIGYILPTVAAGLTDTTSRRTLEHVTDVVRRDIGALRALITDIYPPDLSGPGLLLAVEDLSRQAGEAGVEVTATVHDAAGALSPAGRALAYRIVREGLRNVVRHSRASRAWVEVGVGQREVSVRVADDGVGPTTADVGEPAGQRDGHVGLQLLADSLVEAGGRLELRAREPDGAELLARFPESFTL